MAELEYGGVKLTGSKLFMIIPLVSMLGGGLWAGFEFYKDYMDMKEQIQSYVAPDLSGFDKKLAVLKKEMVALSNSVETSTDVMRETKHDLRDDLVRMERILDKVENDIDVVEDEATSLMDRTKKETRELILDANNRFNDKIDGMEGYVKRELQQLEDEMNTKLTKALDNPFLRLLVTINIGSRRNVMSVETEIALLKKEVDDMKGIHVRLDTAIEKIADVSSHYIPSWRFTKRS